MKKVLLSAYACLPAHGSEEGNGWNYATLLSQNGYKIHCLTKHQNRSVLEPALADNVFPHLVMHYVPVPGWVDRFYHKGLVGMYFHYLYWQWSAYRLARQLDQTQHFDLVHHVTYGSIQLGSFMYKLGKPFIFGPVGGGQRAPASMKRYFGKYWSREWMRDWMSSLLQHLNPGFYRTLRLADRVIVTNTDTFLLARSVRQKSIDRLLDAGLSDSFLPAQPINRPPGTELKLLWVGRLMPRKALELTIEAFAKVSVALPITLTIVGGQGEMADQVPRYIDQYGVGDRVQWAGHVSHDEVKGFYEQSDVFFFTSLRDSCPMQVLEAMAYSLPVVTLNLHGQSELINDSNGLKITVTTPEQVTGKLAEAIEWLYANPKDRLAMGEAAYQFAQSQVWSTKIRQFVDHLYPAVLSQTTPTLVV